MGRRAGPVSAASSATRRSEQRLEEREIAADRGEARHEQRGARLAAARERARELRPRPPAAHLHERLDHHEPARARKRRGGARELGEPVGGAGLAPPGTA